jgi:S-formylglutathione hydrolase FrmB
MADVTVASSVGDLKYVDLGSDVLAPQVVASNKKATAVNLTANGQILAGPGQLLGYYVNSTSSGTVRISNALTATTPYLGEATTPAVGWHNFPCGLSTGGYVTIGSTIDATFFVIPDES